MRTPTLGPHLNLIISQELYLYLYLLIWSHCGTELPPMDFVDTVQSIAGNEKRGASLVEVQEILLLGGDI